MFKLQKLILCFYSFMNLEIKLTKFQDLENALNL